MILWAHQFPSTLTHASLWSIHACLQTQPAGTSTSTFSHAQAFRCVRADSFSHHAHHLCTGLQSPQAARKLHWYRCRGRCSRQEFLHVCGRLREPWRPCRARLCSLRQRHVLDARSGVQQMPLAPKQVSNAVYGTARGVPHSPVAMRVVYCASALPAVRTARHATRARMVLRTQDTCRKLALPKLVRCAWHARTTTSLQEAIHARCLA